MANGSGGQAAAGQGDGDGPLALQRIQKLPDHVANQIAAGEVVERPAAVVKELLENALDAGARRIEVAFRQGGKGLIRVTDNGHGMSPADARLALERHATSKLRSARDLKDLHTLGFRGEALPSIASVSTFVLRTRTADADVGTQVRVAAPAPPEVSACGCPVGTSVEVQRLFARLPARRKFLRTDRTEAGHIVQTVRLLALAHPEVAFTLIEDGRTVFEARPQATRRDRAQELYGVRVTEGLLELDLAEGPLRLEALLSPPGVGRATRAELLTFINGRPIESATLKNAFGEAYQTHIPHGRHPQLFAFLTLPADWVDVNVHPTKREVRFRDDHSVRRWIVEPVAARLSAAAREALPVPKQPAGQPEGAAAAPPPTPPRAPQRPIRPLRASAPAAPPASTPEPPAAATRAASPAPGAAPAPQPSAAPPAPENEGPAAPVPEAPGVVRSALPTWQFLGVLRDDLLLFASPEGLVHLHVRAAWERIFYEELAAEDDAPQYQQLLFPQALTLDPVEAELLEAALPLLAPMGVIIERFGKDFYRVEAVPDWLQPEAAVALITDWLAQWREEGLPARGTPRLREALLRWLARRRVRQAAFPKEPERAQALLERLLSTERPLADPEGRPTFYEVPLREIYRQLGRTS